MSGHTITSAVVRRAPKELRELVSAAADVGWRYRDRQRGGFILLAPDGVNSVNIPARMDKGSTRQHIAAQIARFTPLSAEAQATLGQHVGSATSAAAEKIAQEVRENGGVAVEEVEVRDTAFGTFAEVTYIEPRRVVNEKPWLARVGSRETTTDLYPSKAVVERTWNDGTVDYVCAEPGCLYHHDKARSVTSHFAAVHSRGKGAQPIAPPVQFAVAHDGPRVRRYTHLAKEIEAALRAIEKDSPNDPVTLSRPAELARNLAERIIDARVASGKEKADAEPEPASAEEIVERMRALLMRDEQRQADALRREIEVMQNRLEGFEVGARASIDHLTKERDEALAEAERLREWKKALAGLVRDEEGEQ